MNIAMVLQWLPTKDKGDWKHGRPPSGSRLLEERVSQRRDPDDDDGNVNNLEGISSRVDGSASRTDLIHMERVSSLPTGRIKRAEAHAPNSTPHEGSGIAKVKIAQSTPPSNITSTTSPRPVISPSLLEQCFPPTRSFLLTPIITSTPHRLGISTRSSAIHRTSDVCPGRNVDACYPR